jgi:hypothetical protein
VPVRRWLTSVGAVALSAGLVTACGSSGSAASTASSSAVHQSCKAVAGVLADGPDPDADPVGYALAQVTPLRQVKSTSDRQLHTAIDQLASAYQRFVTADGVGAPVKRAVTQASDHLDTLCPGVAS